ncbi:hypothetical protein ACVW1A_004592 [Bradyrhizobium sp. LB1.3]
MNDRGDQLGPDHVGRPDRGHDLPVQAERLGRQDQARQEQRHAARCLSDKIEGGSRDGTEIQSGQREQDPQRGGKDAGLGQRVPQSPAHPCGRGLGIVLSFANGQREQHHRGVYGQRDIVFLNQFELDKRGLADGDRVDLVTVSTDGRERRVRNFRVVGYSFPNGCCAAYYPETNPLVPLYAHDPLSFTPSSKGIPVRIERTGADVTDESPHQD